MDEATEVTVLHLDGDYYAAGLGSYRGTPDAILSGPNGGRFVIILEGDAEYLESAQPVSGKPGVYDYRQEETEDDRPGLGNDLREAYQKPNPNRPLPGMED